ncbi:DUF6412 domain-containing protein [Leifsonia sp. NPDC080035]|uniref:DUF6412 domain-containing protein n=1 Tax=Leifsonia sp. NPDC080035 TaxID=3143936 RepID=A0AAU7G9F1_9MICO
MSAVLELIGRVFASAVTPSTLSPSGLVALAGLVGAIGIVAAIATAAVRSVAALAASLRVRASWSTPAEPPAGWLVESEADPDADGHPRPRAPGILLPAV